jgi:hypothetical protein
MIPAKLTELSIKIVANAIVSLQGDPGLPGGDPDLPDTPLDGGVYVLVALALIYGYRKLSATNRAAKP